jgi:chemotaxis response regulator CheB
MTAPPGFAEIKRKAGITIAQHLETCVYPNLVQCAAEQGVVDFLVNENDLSCNDYHVDSQRQRC